MAQTKHSISHYIIDVILSMILLTHIANYFKYSRKRKQSSNHVGYYWIVSKKATLFKINSLWLCRLRFLLEFLTEYVPKEPRIRIPFKELNHQGGWLIQRQDDSEMRFGTSPSPWSFWKFRTICWFFRTVNRFLVVVGTNSWKIAKFRWSVSINWLFLLFSHT